MDIDKVREPARRAGIDQDTLCRNEGWVEPMVAFAALVVEEAAKIAEGLSLESQRSDAATAMYEDLRPASTGARRQSPTRAP